MPYFLPPEKVQQARALLMQSQLDGGLKLTQASIARTVGIGERTVARLKAELDKEQEGNPAPLARKSSQHKDKDTNVNLYQWIPRGASSFTEAVEIGYSCKGLGLESDASRRYCQERNVDFNEVYRFVKVLENSSLVPQSQYEQIVQQQQQQLQVKDKNEARLEQQVKSLQKKVAYRDKVISLLTQGIVSGKFKALLEELED